MFITCQKIPSKAGVFWKTNKYLRCGLSYMFLIGAKQAEEIRIFQQNIKMTLCDVNVSGLKGKCVALKAILIFILEGELLISFLTTLYNTVRCILLFCLQNVTSSVSKERTQIVLVWIQQLHLKIHKNEHIQINVKF